MNFLKENRSAGAKNPQNFRLRRYGIGAQLWYYSRDTPPAIGRQPPLAMSPSRAMNRSYECSCDVVDGYGCL